MNNEVIRLDNIVKNYKIGTILVEALRSVSLVIQKNEFVALMGPSGSGKSTLMNILGCLDTPTSGNYMLNGEDVSKMDDNALAEIRNRQIGFVFQTFNLLPRSTALENVMLPLIYAGIGKAKRVELATKSLEEVKLADRMAHRPNEPTGNLDSKTSVEILGLLEEIHKMGNTVIIVTHEEDIAQHAHRIIRLMDGKIHLDEANKNIKTIADYHFSAVTQ
jgi:putative ABC transport system ATP-binding protein